MKQKYIQYIATNEVLPAMLTTDNILFTSGASEAINLVLQAFCDPFKDHICVTPPTFGLYEELAIRHQVDVKISPLLGKNFDQLNFIELKNSNAKIIYLCSPNNPVGTELKFNEIHHLLTNISNTIIVIDETYFDFSSNKKWLALLGEYENLVFIRSFSKAWGLAGVRAGVVIANKSIIDVLRLIQLPFTFSEPAQESVSKRLEQIDDIHKLIVSLLIYVKCYLVF
ncbi:MAG: aminotransferase class I/II-fold pyridoxal phosphate-dependent enzyme [Legionella sp.]|nr:aminotransferase class I/II-fold pyridoxal phosphate-dependent enzyme [Legionella sp.]